MSYEPAPTYPLAGGEVEIGFGALAAALERRRPRVLAIDGPATLDWESAVAKLEQAGAAFDTVDVRRFLVAAAELEQYTVSALLAGDSVFARVAGCSLADLFDDLPGELSSTADLTVVFGPGSSLVPHDALWYFDEPKRIGLAAVRAGTAATLGRPPGLPDAERNLCFVDWPVLDAHKRLLAAGIDRYADLSDPAQPRSIAGDVLRRTLAELAGRPFRTRPTFLPGPWGGQWLRGKLGIPSEAANLAWSYELIAPDAGVLLGAGEQIEQIEVGFEWLLAARAEAILGAEVAERFGTSFPIRFDYLDTLGGGHLSIQCHPTAAYMSEVFGLPYTQDETYYVVETSPGATIFLGLREDADLNAFRADAERAATTGIPFEPERYLQRHAAEQHRLYAIPAGTPHASGAGNAVLEVSATPYLYTLRFYDWLRRDLEGKLRPVHLDHAFANLDPERRGGAVARELIREPSTVRGGEGWVELDLGTPAELFYAVHRLDFEEEVEEETGGRFHVVGLVAGEEVVVESSSAAHPLSFAETLVIPAAVGRYRVRRVRGGACKLVKAFVR
ncbi:MAG: class I mannose-6-phosphate isomerase [Gaiellaceae bacterium]